MRLRFTAFLLIANLFVFGLIWQSANERNRVQPPPELIFPVNADKIALTIPDGAGSYELRHRDGRWHLVSPYEWPADPWIVDKLLNQLRFVTREGGFSLAEAGRLDNTLAAYGLDQPRLSLTVGAPGTPDTSVKIGAATAAGNAVYLLAPDGATVLTPPRELLAELLRKPDDLRRTQILTLDPFEIRAVTLTVVKDGKETRIGLVRGKGSVGGEESGWRFETPVATDADTPLVDKHLATLGELRFRRFLPPAPGLLEKTGLSSPEMRLVLEGNNRRQTLLVGNPDPDEKIPHRFAKFEDNASVFTIPEVALAPWVEARNEMRDHRFLRFAPLTLTGITIHEGARALILQRLEEKTQKPAESLVETVWRMPVLPGSTATTPHPVDAPRIAALADALAALSAQEFRPPAGTADRAPFRAFVTDEPTPLQLAGWGFSHPRKRVTLTFKNGTTRTLDIAAPTGPGQVYHAKLADAPTVYSIAPGILEHLSVEPHFYRRRALDPLAPGARVTALKITDLRSGKVLTDERKPDDIPAWETWLDNRPKADRDALLALAAVCRDPRAHKFLAATYKDDYRYDAGDGRDPEPWRYALEYTVKTTAEAKPETRVLRFTRRLAGSEQIGGSAAHDAVFFLTREWIDAIFALTFARDSQADAPTPPAPAPLK